MFTSRVVSSIWPTKPALANFYPCQDPLGKIVPLKAVMCTSATSVSVRVNLAQMVGLAYLLVHHSCKSVFFVPDENVAFPHEAIRVFNFFTVRVDAFPHITSGRRPRVIGKCINKCCEKVEHENCLMWKRHSLMGPLINW